MNKRLIVITVALAIWPSSLPAPAQASDEVRLHERRANDYLAQKNPQLAVPEFREVLAADPTNLNAQANLGVLLFFQQQYPEAIVYLRQAVAQKPDLGKIQALLGLAEKSVGDQEKARSDLDAAVMHIADVAIQIQAGLALIELDAATQDFDQAQRVVALLRQASPTDPRVLYAAYRIASDQSSEALLSLSLAAPESAQMHQAMAHELERALDNAGAVQNFRKAAELDPGLPGVHYELAEALQNSNDAKLRSEAEAEYRLALKQNPADARSAVALGDLRRAHGDLQAAQGFYRQALTVDANLAEAAIPLASLDAERGDLTAAAAKLEAVLAADPTSTLAHYRLGAVYRKLGRTAEAQQQVEMFQHYRKLKETMDALYREMRQQPPGNADVANEHIH